MLWILSKIGHIYCIHDHYHCFRLMRFSLDSASNNYNPELGFAMAVEQCQCPVAYQGLSCEECADGYYRAATGPYGGYCVPCQCNGHTNMCDKTTGICIVSTFLPQFFYRPPFTTWYGRQICRLTMILSAWLYLVLCPRVLSEDYSKNKMIR